MKKFIILSIIAATFTFVACEDEFEPGGTSMQEKMCIRDRYTLTYSVTNDDGFTTSVTRTVIVEDPTITTDISGTYITVEGTYRDMDGIITNYPGFDVTITKVAGGFFYVSDLLGGYYDQRARYSACLLYTSRCV